MRLPSKTTRRKCYRSLFLTMLLLTPSCAPTTTDPIKNPLAVCPPAEYPTDAAWAYRDSLPLETPAQQQFRAWTARILVEQTLLPGK